MPGRTSAGHGDVIEGEVVSDQYRDPYSTDPEDRDG
jgi:hypothetical protein